MQKSRWKIAGPEASASTSARVYGSGTRGTDGTPGYGQLLHMAV